MAKLKGGPEEEDLITLSDSVEEFACNLMERTWNSSGNVHEKAYRILQDHFDLILETSLAYHSKKVGNSVDVVVLLDEPGYTLRFDWGESEAWIQARLMHQLVSGYGGGRTSTYLFV